MGTTVSDHPCIYDFFHNREECSPAELAFYIVPQHLSQLVEEAVQNNHELQLIFIGAANHTEIEIDTAFVYHFQAF